MRFMNENLGQITSSGPGYEANNQLDNCQILIFFATYVLAAVDKSSGHARLTLLPHVAQLTNALRFLLV